MLNFGWCVVWLALCAAGFGVLWLILYPFVLGFEYVRYRVQRHRAWRSRRRSLDASIRIRDLLADLGHEPLQRGAGPGRHRLDPARGKHSRAPVRPVRRPGRRRAARRVHRNAYPRTTRLSALPTMA